MPLKIRKAVKDNSNLRMAFCGPSKSGKTFTMLAIATGHNPFTGEKTQPLVDGPIGLIDSERNHTDKGESEKYADLFDFDVIVLERTHADYYTEAIKTFADQKYPLIIIDGISPEWVGQDGCLEVVHRIAKQKYKNDSHRAWKDVNKFHDRLILGDEGNIGIKNYPGHVFVSIRAKIFHARNEIKLPNGGKKTEIVKIGIGPIQRGEIEYEFDTFFDLNSEHIINTNGATRIPGLGGQEFAKPGPDITNILLDWLGEKK